MNTDGKGRLAYGTYFTAKFYYVWHLFDSSSFNESSGCISTMSGYWHSKSSLFLSFCFFGLWLKLISPGWSAYRLHFWVGARERKLLSVSSLQRHMFHLLITLMEEAVQLGIICMDGNIKELEVLYLKEGFCYGLGVSTYDHCHSDSKLI